MRTQLKADWPHPRNYPHKPTDNRHTDKHLRLVMVLIVLLHSPKSSPWYRPLGARKSTLTFDLDPDRWPWNKVTVMSKRFLGFDLWPMTLTYNPNLYKVKVDLHTKYQGRTSNSRERGTDWRYQVHYWASLRVIREQGGWEKFGREQGEQGKFTREQGEWTSFGSREQEKGKI